MRSKRAILSSVATRLLADAAALALVIAPGVAVQPAMAQTPAGASPAVCGAGDIREPGIQGELPAGQKPNYNCGLKLIGSLPISGNVQGLGNCVYLRERGPQGAQDDAEITVIDVKDPTRPTVVGKVPVHMGSETFRVVATPTRAVMVSGSSVYDVRDCLHPQHLGEIKWPDTSVPGVTRRNLPHDIRVNRDGTMVYATFGVWTSDISDLAHPESWKIGDHRCELAAQLPGPWQAMHRDAIKAGLSLCVDARKPAPQGANYLMGASPLQAGLLWPQLSHSLDFNIAGNRIYVGDQAGGMVGLWAPVAKVRIIDITQTPYKVIGEVDGAGHGLDYFRVKGRDYVIHSNERGAGNYGDPASTSCHPYPRPTNLGWAYDAYVSDVTDPAQAHHISLVTLNINRPEFCQQRKTSQGDASIAYHLIDNPLDAKFTLVNFQDAGLRMFDIRDPEHPTEVAYFNHGLPTHAGVGYYDAARGLLYGSGVSGFWVLKIEPQVKKTLGL